MAKKKRNDAVTAVAGNLHSRQDPLSMPSLALILLGIVVFFPPFFRGMFFREEFVFVHMATAIVFLFYYQTVFVRESRPLLADPLDYANLALVLCYLLAIFGAISKDLGIAFAWRQINYFALFWLAAHTVRSTGDVRRLLQVLYASGLVMAGITLGTMMDLWHYNAAYQGGIVQTTLQYKNAGAIFLTALSYLGFYFWAGESRPWLRSLYGIGNYIYMFIIFGSQSRAVWVLYPIFFALLVAGGAKGTRLRSVFNFFLITALTFTVSSKVLINIQDQAYGKAMVWLVAAFVIITLVQYLHHYLNRRQVNLPLVVAGGTLGILLLLSGVFLIREEGAPNGASFLPANIYEKIKTLSIKERNINERTYFWRDGLTMVRERPILGYGGGAWRSGYRQFASYHYNSNEEHNHFMKVAVETGLLGLLAYLAIWLSFYLLVIRTLLKAPPGEAKALLWLVAVGVTALGAHSFFDFDLSLGAIAIVLWTFFGLARGLEGLARSQKPGATIRTAKGAKATHPLWQQALVWTVGLVFFGFSFSVMLANHYYAKGQEAAYAQDAETARTYFEKTRTFNPFFTENLAQLGQIYTYLAQTNNSPADYQTALDYAGRAVSLEPADARWHQLYAYILFRGGRVGEALAETEKIIDSHPFGPTSYEAGAKNYFQAGMMSLLEDNDPAKAREYFREVLNFPRRIDRQLAKLDQEEKTLMETGNGFNLPAGYTQALGQASVLLGRPAEALKYFAQVEKLDAEGQFWKGLALEKQGRSEEAREAFHQAYQENPSLQDLYNRIIKYVP